MITHMTIDELKNMLRVEMQEALATIPPVEGMPQEDLLVVLVSCLTLLKKPSKTLSTSTLFPV